MRIHRTTLVRLITVWFILATTIGSVVYYFEHKRIDQLALDLAINHSNTFTPSQIQSIETKTPEILLELQSKVEELTRRQFVAIDIYDIERNHLAAAFNYDTFTLQNDIEQRHHQFLMDATLHYEKFTSEGQSLIQILLPLKSPQGETKGYFEGVYHVDEQTITLINERIYYFLTLAILASLVTAIVLYPVILRLNRELVIYSRDLLNANLELLEVLGSAIASRDATTNSHNYRVTLYAVRLGEQLGLKPDKIQDLIIGSFLHDVGKIGVDDAILKKKGLLTPEEIIKMQEHVTIGVEIVNKSKWLSGAKDIIAFHHEKYDGSGYSQNLKGEDIPLSARIFAVADVFDALTSERPYKRAFSYQESSYYLITEKHKHFDPTVVDNFIEIASRLHEEIGQATDEALSEELSAIIQEYFYGSKIQKTLFDYSSNILAASNLTREKPHAHVAA